MRGKRSEKPLEWRLDFCSPSNATSSTTSGRTTCRPPCRSRVSASKRSVSAAISTSVSPLYALPMSLSSLAVPHRERVVGQHAGALAVAALDLVTTTSSVAPAFFTLSHALPRRPASYGASTLFETSPSLPRARAA